MGTLRFLPFGVSIVYWRWWIIPPSWEPPIAHLRSQDLFGKTTTNIATTTFGTDTFNHCRELFMIKNLLQFILSIVAVEHAKAWRLWHLQPRLQTLLYALPMLLLYNLFLLPNTIVASHWSLVKGPAVLHPIVWLLLRSIGLWCNGWRLLLLLI